MFQQNGRLLQTVVELRSFSKFWAVITSLWRMPQHSEKEVHIQCKQFPFQRVCSRSHAHDTMKHFEENPSFSFSRKCDIRK